MDGKTARIEAKRILGTLLAGQEPTKGNAPASVPTVAEVCDRYMKSAQAGAILTRFNRPKKASTLTIDVGRIERHIKPLIGSQPIDAVDGRIVRQMIEDITGGQIQTRNVRTSDD